MLWWQALQTAMCNSLEAVCQHTASNLLFIKNKMGTIMIVAIENKNIVQYLSDFIRIIAIGDDSAGKPVFKCPLHKPNEYCNYTILRKRCQQTGNVSNVLCQFAILYAIILLKMKCARSCHVHQVSIYPGGRNCWNSPVLSVPTVQK